MCRALSSLRIAPLKSNYRMDPSVGIGVHSARRLSLRRPHRFARSTMAQPCPVEPSRRALHSPSALSNACDPVSRCPMQSPTRNSGRDRTVAPPISSSCAGWRMGSLRQFGCHRLIALVCNIEPSCSERGFHFAAHPHSTPPTQKPGPPNGGPGL